MTGLRLIKHAANAGAFRPIHTSALMRDKATKRNWNEDWKTSWNLMKPDVKLLEIQGATFYRQYPSPALDQQHNPKLFPNLDFMLEFLSPEQIANPMFNGRATWCIIGPSLSGKTTFLEVLQGKHICIPPTARTFKVDQHSIRFAGFDTAHRGGGLGQLTSTYLAERYESRRELTDFSLRDYLLDNTQLNPASTKTPLDKKEQNFFNDVVARLNLKDLLDLPVTFLSNGQGRRALIAHALLQRPTMLLLDEPFMGLDPPTVQHLNQTLCSLATESDPLGRAGLQSPTLVLTARPQDPVPKWITHIAYLTTDGRVAYSGKRADVYHMVKKYVRGLQTGSCPEDPTLPFHLVTNLCGSLKAASLKIPNAAHESDTREGTPIVKREEPSTKIFGKWSKVKIGEPVVEMSGCTVKYGDKAVLGDWEQQGEDGEIRKGLHWTVRRGERWGVFGPNGSGKTTIVSLLCSDHPQTYSLPIKLFGRSRLPDPESKELPLTYWDIQSCIGHSSPEVHQHMPRGLSVRQVLENAWADTFRSKPQITYWARDQIDATLTWFDPEINPLHDPCSDRRLDWANSTPFGELSFSAQRVLLFLRAIIKQPDIIVLDEAFSGMDSKVRGKCMSWLEKGTSSGKSKVPEDAFSVKGLSDQQALICISHVREEVPDAVRSWICLPEANTGRPARFGELSYPLARGPVHNWDSIWGLAEEPAPKVPAFEVPEPKAIAKKAKKAKPSAPKAPSPQKSS